MRATRQAKLFWAGLSIYALSFILMGIAEPFSGSRPVPGYWCALFALASPFDWTPSQSGGLFEHKQFGYVAMIVSGWINPVFLAFVCINVFGGKAWMANVLRAIIPLMIPFCWVVFHYQHLIPREGHFLWIVGMLLVLYSAKVATDSARAPMMYKQKP